MTNNEPSAEELLKVAERRERALRQTRQANDRARKSAAEAHRLSAELVELRRVAVEAANLRAEVARLRAAAAPPSSVDPVVEAVRAELHRRSQLGIAKYGCTLGDSGLGLRAYLRHAFEEALDLCNYLQGSLMALDAAERPRGDRAAV